jgi:hypothetical protein
MAIPQVMSEPRTATVEREVRDLPAAPPPEPEARPVARRDPDDLLRLTCPYLPRGEFRGDPD